MIGGGHSTSTGMTTTTAKTAQNSTRSRSFNSPPRFIVQYHIM